MALAARQKARALLGRTGYLAGGRAAHVEPEEEEELPRRRRIGGRTRLRSGGSVMGAAAAVRADKAPRGKRGGRMRLATGGGDAHPEYMEEEFDPEQGPPLVRQERETGTVPTYQPGRLKPSDDHKAIPVPEAEWPHRNARSGGRTRLKRGGRTRRR